MSEGDSKRTPLYGWHKSHGARIVDFAGWRMPLQYEEGPKSEHLYTREEASLFDVSHMGEIRFQGKEALKALSFLVPTDIEHLKAGQAQYTFFVNMAGGVVDDLIIYCIEPETNYLVCVNAANTEKAYKHAKEHTKKYDTEVIDESESWAQVAVQGPQAMKMCEKIFPGTEELQRFHFGEFSMENGAKVLIARTGYTGEDGVEIFVAPENVLSLWGKFLGEGAKPCGLAARDSLRLEAALNLYGNELTDDCNPYESRMSWTISKNKTQYIGHERLKDLKKLATKKLMGIKSEDRALPRKGYPVFTETEEELIGQVTSGTLSPSLSQPIAMVWIDKKSAERDKNVKVKVRNKFVEAKIVSLPFVKKI